MPRHPERFESVAKLLDQSGLAWQRRSQLNATSAQPDARILLVDTIGELGAWWGTAAIGFVGGSLGSRGGQNMIEPAAYGTAACFGPNTQNFRDVVSLLLDAHGAEVVRDPVELAEFVRRMLDDPAARETLGQTPGGSSSGNSAPPSGRGNGCNSTCRESKNRRKTVTIGKTPLADRGVRPLDLLP